MTTNPQSQKEDIVDNGIEKLLTVTDVASYLGVSVHTIYQWVKAGHFPAKQF